MRPGQPNNSTKDDGGVADMLNDQIRELQDELNRLIDRGVGGKELYEMSVRLDRLIARYYAEGRHGSRPSKWLVDTGTT